MSKNLKVLDKFDKKVNIYELICKMGERAHKILEGASVSPDVKEKEILQIVMEELLLQEKK